MTAQYGFSCSILRKKDKMITYIYIHLNFTIKCTNNINICWQLCTTCLQVHCCSYYSNIYNLTNSQFSSFLERARSKLLGSLKQKYSWHDLMMSILLVLNSFMKNLSTTKSNDLISDFFRWQASRSYIRIGIQYIYLKLADNGLTNKIAETAVARNHRTLYSFNCLSE